MRLYSGLVLTTLLWVWGCDPELGDRPFSCTNDGSCPQGYACRVSECVREGVTQSAVRAMRVVWINAGEMYWLPGKRGGATLVVNDGFTPGEHAIYEIVVDPEGKVKPARRLLDYGDEFPSASSVVALDNDRYGIVMLSFPNVSSSDLTLKLLGVEREAPAGATPAVETLYAESQPYLGGTEPAYVGAVAEGGALDVAWTRPTNGGSVVLMRLQAQGSARQWGVTRSLERGLPPSILPLSGDCLLWPDANGGRVLRVGFETFSTLTVDGQGQAASEFLSTDDVPLYGWGDATLSLRYGDEDPASGAFDVSYVLSGGDGTELAVEPAGYLQGALEPFTALPYGDGVLVAPLSPDPAFSTLDVAFRSPSRRLTTVASFERGSTDEIYSARAFGFGS
jgi:hypothetical protein